MEWMGNVRVAVFPTNYNEIVQDLRESDGDQWKPKKKTHIIFMGEKMEWIGNVRVDVFPTGYNEIVPNLHAIDENYKINKKIIIFIAI